MQSHASINHFSHVTPYFQNYATCVVGTPKVFLVFWLPSIKLRTICFYSKKPKMISKFQPLEYYRKKDKFASFQNLQSKNFVRASRIHIWLTAAKAKKTGQVVSSAGRVILKIGVMTFSFCFFADLPDLIVLDISFQLKYICSKQSLGFSAEVFSDLRMMSKSEQLGYSIPKVKKILGKKSTA